MGVFKDLKQVGYKQKSEFAIEALDNMDSNNIEKFIEIRLALRWFHTLGFHYSAIPYVGDGVMKYIALVIDGESRTKMYCRCNEFVRKASFGIEYGTE